MASPVVVQNEVISQYICCACSTDKVLTLLQCAGLLCWYDCMSLLECDCTVLCTDETIAALRQELADERQSKEELIRTWKMANEEFMRMQMDQEQETKEVHQQLDVARR